MDSYWAFVVTRTRGLADGVEQLMCVFVAWGVDSAGGIGRDPVPAEWGLWPADAPVARALRQLSGGLLACKEAFASPGGSKKTARP